ncbi:MAG: transcription termination/antitermination protein NusA [Anaerolineales bacterium]|nr:transcription termination/antitermination protein NusA [Anaerolineales bacterium]
MRNEFALAFNEVLEHYGLPREAVLEVVQAAMVNAYRKAVNASTAQQVEANVDLAKGTIQILAEKEVVESITDGRTEVLLEEAREVNPKAALGDLVLVDSTPEDFGRIATQAAKQQIHQKLRDAEREKQFEEWSARKGEIVHGTVQSVGPMGITVSLGRAEAALPKREQLPTERYKPRDRIRAVLMDVSKTSRGPQIILSRSDRNMLRRLLEAEVPEIYQGMVEIKGIAREPGLRSKVAVAAMQPNLDPVGACVGMRGGRIQAIVRELHDEKIDVIEWNPDPASFIAKALSPARVSGVYLDDDPVRGRTALVVVSEDQLSLAIGREGVNARLAAKLTGWRVDIKSVAEAAAEAVQKLGKEEILAPFVETQGTLIEQVQNALGRKAEGKPLPPEDYSIMNQFVTGVEKILAEQREGRRKAQTRRLAEIRKNLPASAYEHGLDTLGLADGLDRALAAAGMESIGQSYERIMLDPDSVLSLPEMGVRNFEKLKESLESMILDLRADEKAEAEQAAAEKAQEAAVAEAPSAEAVLPAAGETPAAVPEATAAADIEAPAAEAAAEAASTPAETEEEEEEETEEESKGGKKKKKGKLKAVVEFDPETGMTVARRKRKPGRVKDLLVDGLEED